MPPRTVLPISLLRLSHRIPNPPSRLPHPTRNATNPPRHFQLQRQFPRNYTTPIPNAKPQADQIVEELQELYETAQDEFEIATDSTNGATIYAASDRESARDALDQLVGVFALYTTDVAGYSVSDDSRSQVLSTAFDHRAIDAGVRGEVKRRVEQRVRELENAVVALEERAKED
ncbi:hypothetical protein BDV28DRAFT_148220 [Aspergillus coremiiformis]|uniref:Uncharacterized protein n=1 Tax=Aspergillus coremiiformis TaxID=138285 RepID=A0A5N6Z977_9EURO|nr:hypothetical protein BDV28DRAFT_148220 [Aspergillus coremiiformis]